MFKKVLMAVVAVIATAAFMPAMASATTAVPALHSGDTQAYLLDSSGNPITSTQTITLAGSFMSGRWAMVGAVTLTCNMHLTVDVHPDGTTTVKAPTSFTSCSLHNVPITCDASAAPNLDWGDRLVLDSNGDYRDRINFSLTVTYTGFSCPYGPITYTGELSPVLTFNGSGGLATTFDGAAAGSLSSALGSATASGTIEEQGTLGGYGLGI